MHVEAGVDEPTASEVKMKALVAVATVQGDTQNVLDNCLVIIKVNINKQHAKNRCKFHAFCYFKGKLE